MAQKDVSRAFHRMVGAAQDVGLDTEGWELHPGSTANGISYSVIAGRYGSSDLVGLPPFDHIGKTAKEAERFLVGMAVAFESVAYAERRKGEQS